jgi:hypothetical protein
MDGIRRERSTPPARQIRALFDDQTITVYQAYAPEIAEAAVAAGSFVPPFNLDRMTWIKPSFLWMMYRSGWATKPGQERVLAVRITRAGFEEALSLACLSHHDPAVYADSAAWVERKRLSPVRVQWDPERSPSMAPLPWRSLQIGLGGIAVRSYVHQWITSVTDITERVRSLKHDGASFPEERPYPLPHSLGRHIGASSP